MHEMVCREELTDKGVGDIIVNLGGCHLTWMEFTEEVPTVIFPERWKEVFHKILSNVLGSLSSPYSGDF